MATSHIDIMNALEAFVEAHPQINSYGYGHVSDINSLDTSAFPILFVMPTGGSLGDLNVTNISVYILDLLEQDQSNLMYCLSDSDQLSMDLRANFWQDKEIELGFTLSDANTPKEVFIGSYDHLLGGYKYNYSIESTAGMNACIIPGNGVLRPLTVSATPDYYAEGCDGTQVTVTAVGGVGPYTGTGVFCETEEGLKTYTVTDSEGTSAVTNEVAILVLTPEPLSAIAEFILPDRPVIPLPTVSVEIIGSGGVAPYMGTGTFTQDLFTQESYTVIDSEGTEVTVEADTVVYPDDSCRVFVPYDGIVAFTLGVLYGNNIINFGDGNIVEDGSTLYTHTYSAEYRNKFINIDGYSTGDTRKMHTLSTATDTLLEMTINFYRKFDYFYSIAHPQHPRLYDDTGEFITTTFDYLAATTTVDNNWMINIGHLSQVRYMNFNYDYVVNHMFGDFGDMLLPLINIPARARITLTPKRFGDFTYKKRVSQVFSCLDFTVSGNPSYGAKAINDSDDVANLIIDFAAYVIEDNGILDLRYNAIPTPSQALTDAIAILTGRGWVVYHA